jgi:hypothetical protein
MNKNYALVPNFWHSQKILICFIFLFQSLTGFSQTTIQTRKNEQVKTETPIFSNQEEKDAWEKEKSIKTSSTKIAPIGSTSVNGTTAISTSTTKIIEDETAFPKYIETGDPIKDSENYALRKQKWIEQNPEAYQELINPKK